MKLQTTNNKSQINANIQISNSKLFIFSLAFGICIIFCSCQAKQVKNPTAQIDTEHQTAIEKAVKELKDEYLRVRGSYDDGGVIDITILEILKDKNPEVRGEEVFNLGWLGMQGYADYVAGSLKDKDARVRGNAVWALGRFGAKEYADEIVKLINDSSECTVYDEMKKDWRKTIISAEVKRVLKEWGVDVEKLKNKNEK